MAQWRVEAAKGGEGAKGREGVKAKGEANKKSEQGKRTGQGEQGRASKAGRARQGEQGERAGGVSRFAWMDATVCGQRGVRRRFTEDTGGRRPRTVC